jgi:hypothetical protein
MRKSRSKYIAFIANIAVRPVYILIDQVFRIMLKMILKTNPKALITVIIGFSVMLIA